MKTLTSLLVASLFSLACFGQGNVIPPEPEPSALTKTIANVGMFLNIWEWERTPWARATDGPDMAPVMVIVATDGTACVTDGAHWALAQRGARHACTTAWRLPRS